ncbi:MAG: ribosomal protein S18-alanine N-acetyltransferase [Bauldia sp.]|nr:ribosomal protein S18-alanine N-acetyltransferase [Bauldia sp.]
MMELFPRPRVVVEAIGPDEADALADIHADAFARSWSPAEFESLARDDRVFTLGLRRHSMFWPPRLIGFILIRCAADEAEVLSIAIRSANRGRGHGRRLMDEALRHLYRERIDACFLEVARDNQAAVSLYESLGFETVGERKGYYHREDGPAGAALVMRLKLR